MNTSIVSVATVARIAALTLAFAAAALGTASAFAQVASAAPSSAVPSREPTDALYRELGGEAGLAALVDDFVDRLFADPRIGRFFRDSDPKKVRARLVEQFCELSGGPCRYSGKNMRIAHAGQDITRTDFNALVELLQNSLDARAVPFATQNRLLAHLAPMHRDIVNVH